MKKVEYQDLFAFGVKILFNRKASIRIKMKIRTFSTILDVVQSSIANGEKKSIVIGGESIPLQIFPFEKHQKKNSGNQDF